MVIAFIYILIQILCVIDFSYRWNERWTTDKEPKWLIATLTFALLFIILSTLVTFYEYVRKLCSCVNKYIRDGLVVVI